MIVTFGDGTEYDTWVHVFSALEGWLIGLRTTAGWVEGVFDGIVEVDGYVGFSLDGGQFQAQATEIEEVVIY